MNRPFTLLYKMPFFQKTKYFYFKNIFDRILGAFFLLMALPLLTILSIAIKITSKGPVLFTQYRGGYLQKDFKIYKLRTMYAHLCDDGSQQVVPGDPRVTGFGKFLRRWRLDELPQFWNVLKGDMSLVGPRPHSCMMDYYYRQHIAYYDDRYTVKPGMTGLAQVKRLSGEIRLLQDMQNRIDHDLEYIKQQSFLFDIKILCHTALMPFR